MESEHTATEIAEWMFEKLKRKRVLYQPNVAVEIEKKFGRQFTYTNENGYAASTYLDLATRTRVMDSAPSVTARSFTKC